MQQFFAGEPALGKLRGELLQYLFEDHEEAAAELATVDMDVLEILLQRPGGAFYVHPEPLCEDCFSCSDLSGNQDLRAGGSGLVYDGRESFFRKRNLVSPGGRRGGSHSRLSGSSFLNMVGLESASRTISPGATRLFFCI